jgi:hypothetical protein
MKTNKFFLLFASLSVTVYLFLLSGCSKNNSDSPPPNLPQDSVIVPAPVHWVKVSDSVTNGEIKKYIGTFEYSSKIYFVSEMAIASGTKFGIFEYDTTAKSLIPITTLISTNLEYSPSVFVIGDNVYLHTQRNNTINPFRSFNMVQRNWVNKNSVPVNTTLPVIKQTGFAVNNKGYIVYNYGGSIYSMEFFKYDPASNQWTSDYRSLLNSISLGTITITVNGRPFVIGGSRNLYEYIADSSKVILKAPYTGVCENAFGFSLGDNIHFGTGGDFSISGTGPADTVTSTSINQNHWIYNVSANTWTKKEDFAGGKRAEAIGFTYNGTGYVLGGRIVNSQKKIIHITDLWRYIP